LGDFDGALLKPSFCLKIQSLYFKLNEEDPSSFPLRVEQVSAERIQEAAKNHLSSTQITGVIVGDGRAVRDGLAEFRTFEISAWREPAKEPNAH